MRAERGEQGGEEAEPVMGEGREDGAFAGDAIFQDLGGG